MHRPRILSRTSARAARAARAAATAVLSVSLAAACGGGDNAVTGPGDTVAGTYTLRSVAGRQLPALLFEEGADRIEVTAGALTLNGNGTYAATMTLRLTMDGQVTTETDGARGTYAATGGTIALTDEDGERTTATRSGNSITFTEGDVAMVFTR